MKVVEIQREADFWALRGQWEALLQASPGSIFITWEWMTAWWSAYGKPGELWMLAAFDDHGVLQGIAPLRRQDVHRYSQTVPAIAFVGDGSCDSDYLDFIVAAGWEQPVMDAFAARLREELARGSVLTLNEIPETSRSLPLLKAAAGQDESIWVESGTLCGTVRLPAGWEAYLGMLKPRFRTKVRSVLRNLESRKEVQFGFCQNADEVSRLLPVLFDLHARRWAQDGKPGVFGWDRKREFYAALSAGLLERGGLRFSWLKWNGRVLACQYGFTYGRTYFHLQEGYEPASEHWNVGVGLRAWTIREFLGEGLTEYDFLSGVGRHKIDWGAEVKQSKNVILASASYRNRILFRKAPQWEGWAREAALKVVPDRLMALRRARLSQEASCAVDPGQNGLVPRHHDAGQIRHAAAQCYFHSGLPALGRRLRDRYQLSISSSGKWPRFSWKRRAEGSGRILYYHRVNDENDPFFPSLSTDRFEQVIRFVSRNYKVVSLGDMLHRMDEGAPENLMAVTFDDGYQDNYLNAFPILQRYGVPATIFLTTGSIDSREPLWFERLALAVKMTERDHVDLEVGVPRRFWLRTAPERLDANGQIFTLLKKLPDAERRQWLPEILRQLAVTGSRERKDRMLTWDHIRRMKERGIDFGGHTVTHPFLSRMTREQVAWEVSDCKRRIEVELQSPVNHFAYPNGREEDFGTWNKEVIRAAGYEAAVTTMWGMNYRSTDRMELRRGGPWEEDPALFACKLDWYQLVND